MEFSLETQRAPRRIEPDQAQLLLDPQMVRDCGFVTRIWHQARKYPTPVLQPDRPWEGVGSLMNGTVLHREGRFQMWYVTWPAARSQTGACVCYAESDDGVVWEKPGLGLHEFRGARDNNIVFISESAKGYIDNLCVIHDPDDASWPLKALYWDSGGEWNQPGRWAESVAHRAARSKDGIHWEDLGKVMAGYGDRLSTLPVRKDGKFIALVREPGMERHGKGRVVSRVQSDDLLNWSRPEMVLAPDAEDPAAMEFYSAVCFPYAGLVMGAIERMHVEPDVLDAEIIWSTDGRRWQRSHPRGCFIPRGRDGDWDERWAFLSSSAPVRVGNELWFWYTGRRVGHRAVMPHKHAAIGLATLRCDGFCSLFAGDERGFVQSHEMIWPGGELHVNVDTRRNLDSPPMYDTHGELSVEIRGENGEVIEGFSVGDCPMIHANSALQANDCYVAVRWRDGRSLDALRGRRLSIRFFLRNAHLYAFKAGANRT